MTFEDKTILVTGAGRGIGKAAAIKFAELGGRLVVSDVNTHNLEETRRELESLGRKCFLYQLDVTDLNQIENMVDFVKSELGSVDILFNNAGVTQHIDFFDIDGDDWDRIHEVNARGAFFCMQKVAKLMVETGKGGRIINMGSIAGKGYRRASNAAYSASKGAVISMTYSAANVLSEHDINVNTICPGMVDTDMMENILSLRSEQTGKSDSELRESVKSEIPLGRMNEAKDIVELVVFLAGPSSRNITGQSFNIDGGMIMQ